MRPKAIMGVRAQGRNPYYGIGCINISCPICDVPIGKQCVRWRIINGERHSIAFTLKTPHAERRRVWQIARTTPGNAGTAETKPGG